MSIATRSKRLPVVRDCRRTVILDGRPCSPRRLSVWQARNDVRGQRRNGESVHTYRTTDRDGAEVLVAYVRTAPGPWHTVDHVAFVYEFPVEALLGL
ncbi:hypothetical protein [Kitasatospora sp. NPDC101183]|uniref:hypothetical protein n=1 Tax=Kitasatospora sp. NPDC101183 TaxID=3364100 RepID=UPI0037F71C7F